MIVEAGLPLFTVENSFFKDMIACADANLTVPSRTTVSGEVSEMRKTGEIKICDKLSHIQGMVSLTMDAWSSRVYMGYFSVTIHLVDKYWRLRNVLLDFVRFPMPQNGETTSALLFELWSNCSLLGSLKATKTENTSDMCFATTMLTNMLNIRNNTSCLVVEIHVQCIAHVWCIAHVVNLVVEDCVRDMHEHVNQSDAYYQNCSLQSSVKHHDICETTKRQLGITVALL